jgi:hypothetical protein
MFMAAFGSCWIAAWAYLTYGSDLRIFAVIAIATIGFVYIGARKYVRVRVAERDRTASLKKKFNLINIGQWILIFLAIRVLRGYGHPGWVAPTIMFIVGLHFLPLAGLFAYRPHYLTGCALMLLALAYPMMSSAGPENPLGWLAAGLVLWASALWANVTVGQVLFSPIPEGDGSA